MTINKLELTWYGKSKEIKIEPRILIKDDKLGYFGEEPQQGYNSFSDNMLIHGDNLLALKALEQDFANKIKCVYIDPPYNTGSAFEHYDDNLEHSTWLSLMKPRLEILRKLLTEDGTIWISIDADESHYLKVLCDEIFGRKNFIDEIVWQRSYAPINLKKTLSRAHDTILVYAKNFSQGFELNKLPRNDAALARYKNPDNDPRGLWQSDNLWVGPRVESNVFEIITPSGRSITPPAGYSSRLNKVKFQEYIDDNRIWFGENGNNTPRIKRFLTEVKDGVTPMTWWTRDDIGDNQEAKREIKKLFVDDVFITPKSERLLYRILTIATNEGDLVLDSFLGSGTTTAVAHKMRRRWIGIELGNHAYTHCKLRMDKVIEGEDGGISNIVNWQGGGGYNFFEVAPTLINIDDFGQAVINEKYNPEMLANAVSKHEGYKYEPNNEIYWKQSNNGGKSFLYVTTNHLSRSNIDSIKNNLLDDEYLLIVCKSFDKGLDRFVKNISVKKIPQSLLKNCEYGVENYNLNILSVPIYEDEDDSDE